MEQDNSPVTQGQAVPLCHKAWTAYISCLILVVLMIFVLRLAFNYSELAAAGVLAVSTLLIGYRILLIRSVQLYYDDVGVWVYSGILPWQRGVRGVKWRDMDEATYVTGFWSWLLRSYTVRVGHRFTREGEILLTKMARGKQAVTILNERHQQLIRSGRLA